MCDGVGAILRGTAVDSPHNIVAVAAESLDSVCEPTCPPHRALKLLPTSRCSTVCSARSASVRRALWMRYRASRGLARGALSVVISLLLSSCPDATHTACALQTSCGRARGAEQTLHAGSTRAAGKREATLREEPRLAFPLPRSPTRGEAVQSNTARESSTQKKPPTRNG